MVELGIAERYLSTSMGGSSEVPGYWCNHSPGERCQPAIANGYRGEPKDGGWCLAETAEMSRWIIIRGRNAWTRVQELHGAPRASTQSSEAPIPSGRHRSPCVNDPRGRR